jgi:hypothetical protein
MLQTLKKEKSNKRIKMDGPDIAKSVFPVGGESVTAGHFTYKLVARARTG